MFSKGPTVTMQEMDFHGIAVDPDGQIFVANGCGESLWRLTPDSTVGGPMSVRLWVIRFLRTPF